VAGMPAGTDLDRERLGFAVLAGIAELPLQVFFGRLVSEQRRQRCGQCDVQRLVALKQRIGNGAIVRKSSGGRRQQAQEQRKAGTHGGMISCPDPRLLVEDRYFVQPVTAGTGETGSTCQITAKK
jgi:hypothetical protein